MSRLKYKQSCQKGIKNINICSCFLSQKLTKKYWLEIYGKFDKKLWKFGKNFWEFGKKFMGKFDKKFMGNLVRNYGYLI